jgi:hypothetical protein
VSVVQDFSNDIFVSYSHIDNESFGDVRGGWVDIFHAQLQQFVDVHIGQRTKVWRDRRLTGAEVFSDEIAQQLRSSAVLLTVLSPGYLRSEWCNRELLGFVERAEEQGNLKVGNLQRVVKVLRLPVERGALPLLDEALGTEFFRVDAASGRARDLLLDESADAKQVFNARVDDVAQDLCKLLLSMAESGGAPAASSPIATGAGETVFLAWSTSDVSEERDQLRRELEARGCRVVPVGSPPLESVGVRETVLAMLGEAKVAVHLVGAVRGFVPEGEGASIVEIQSDEELYRESGSSAHRVVWLSAARTRDADVSLLIERLQGLPGGGQLDFLANQSLEDLKTLVLDRLNPPAKAVPALVRTETPLVYLICDQLDRSDVVPIVNYLFDQSLEVRIPLFDGDSGEVRTEHYELLKECDGVLVFWAKANGAWLRSVLRDLNKVFGLGRTEPYRAASLYLAGPLDADKEAFRTHQLSIIRAEREFDPTLVGSFVAKLSA